MALSMLAPSALVMSALVISASAVDAQPAAPVTGTALEQHGDWTVLADGPGKTVCFIATPSRADGKTPAHDGMVLYVSAWPKEGIKTEVSVRLGSAPRKGAAISIAVGSASFKMFAADDRAYVDDATRELKLIEAMKKGAKALLQADAAKDEHLAASFSLTGFAQALQALAAQCP